jgi:hypothetical protein
VGRSAEAGSHVCVCPSPEMLTYSVNCVVLFPSRRENKEHCPSDSTSVTFLTQDNILISLHVFVFVLIVQEDIVFIHDTVFFFLDVCVCVLRKYWSLSWVTWRIFYGDTFPQISQSFLLYKKNAIRFRHCSSRAKSSTPTSTFRNFRIGGIK